MKPYYEHGGVTIYHGDCRAFPITGVDLVVTDPPYGVGKAGWDDMFVLPPTYGAPVVGMVPGVANILQCPGSLGDAFYRWTLSAYLTNGMARGPFGFGNWIACLVYANAGVSLFGPKQDAKAFAIGREEMPEHPCPKPLNVMTWIVSCLPGETVIDPFMGSGTILVAAKNLGRRAIGIEIEERYCEIAARRLAQEVFDFNGSSLAAKTDEPQREIAFDHD